MRSTLTFLVGIAFGIAGTILFYVIDSEPRSKSRDELRVKIDQQAKEIESQRRELAAKSKTVQALPLVAVATPAPAPAATPEKKKNPLEGIASMMDNPAMRKMMSTQQRRMLEENYADLLTQFHFTADEREQFLNLLSAKEMLNMDYSVKVMKAAPEDREALSDELHKATENADDDLREFFNNDADFATYENYRKQLVQRSELRELAPDMNSIHQPLSADQEKSLLDIMSAEQKAAPSTANNMEDPTNMPETMDRMIKEQELLQKRIAARAATVLTTGQLEVLQRTQVKNLEMLKFSAEMSRTMFPSPTPTPQ
ncbi:MAG: hypothetical protein ACREKL_09030 [Chthoniobacterales bacterium]